MAALLTLEQAKKHLRLPDTSAEDDDLQAKLVQAQAIVLDYLRDTTNTTWTATMDAWTDETVPATVQAAILMQLGYLYRYRGDEPDEVKSEYGNLAPGVIACVYRLRQPVIA